MDSLLNSSRPSVFCPGCSHDQVLHALDQALTDMGISGEDVVIVTDIGCSGLFDTFFNTHAFHGLHGRALTYATGIKMARPDLKVIVTMGDGGLGIGGAHVLSTCRRNIDLTLLVLNNFNYGMTGGQCSATTPQDAQVGSGFLNRLEKPLDICQVAGGGRGVSMYPAYPHTTRGWWKASKKPSPLTVFRWSISGGFAPAATPAATSSLPRASKRIWRNFRNWVITRPATQERNTARAYRQEAAKLQPAAEPVRIEATCKSPQAGRQGSGRTGKRRPAHYYRRRTAVSGRGFGGMSCGPEKRLPDYRHAGALGQRYHPFRYRNRIYGN